MGKNKRRWSAVPGPAFLEYSWGTAMKRISKDRDFDITQNAQKIKEAANASPAQRLFSSSKTFKYFLN